MALRYTACELLKFKQNYYLANDTYANCGDVGILRHKCYLHRSTRHSFICLLSDAVSYPAFLRKPQRLVFFNARSVNNKAVTSSDIILEEKLDLLSLVETWHKQSDGLLFNELTPAGYVAVPLFSSFECLVLTVSECHSTDYSLPGSLSK